MASYLLPLVGIYVCTGKGLKFLLRDVRLTTKSPATLPNSGLGWQPSASMLLIPSDSG